MIGLEYILNLYNVQHVELANKLGIKKQNINLWIKGRQKVSKKYLPILSDLFGIEAQYFSKELTELDMLEIQKEKLKQELEPIIEREDFIYEGGQTNGIVEKPVYNREEINSIERTIEKAKVLERFKEAMAMVDKNPYMDTYKLMAKLMASAQDEIILHKTIEALAHYLEALPPNIVSNEEQEVFESEIFEVFEEFNH